MEDRTQKSLEAPELWPWPSLSSLGLWITSNATFAIYQVTVSLNSVYGTRLLTLIGHDLALWDQFAFDNITASLDTSLLHLHQQLPVSSPTRPFDQILSSTQYPSPVFSHDHPPLDPHPPHHQYNFNDALIATNQTTTMSSPSITTSTTEGELPYEPEPQTIPPLITKYNEDHLRTNESQYPNKPRATIASYEPPSTTSDIEQTSQNQDTNLVCNYQACKNRLFASEIEYT